MCRTDEWCLRLGLEDQVKEEVLMRAGLAIDKRGKLRLREKDIAKTITDFLRAHGWMCFRLQSGTVRGLRNGAFITLNPAGTPDFICIRWKRFDQQILFLETKSPNGKLSQVQRERIWELSINGYSTCVSNSFSEFLEYYKANCG